MIGFILTLTAILLFIIIFPFAFIWQVIRGFKNMGFYFFQIAISIDQFCNVTFSKLLNDCMIKNGGYEYGNPDETISSVTGKNKEADKLTLFGMGIATILDKIQKNHVEKAIDNKEIDNIK